MSSSPTQDVPYCRICFDDGGPDLISPCKCKADRQYVHRSCLDKWRASHTNPKTFTHCEVCQFEYRVQVLPSKEHKWALARFRAFVIRDSLLFFSAIQLMIVGLGWIISLIDTSEAYEQALRKLFPDLLTDREVYYVCGLIAFLALLGVIGALSWCFLLECTLPTPEHIAEHGLVPQRTPPVPSAPPSAMEMHDGSGHRLGSRAARRASRRRRARASPRCDCCVYYDCTYWEMRAWGNCCEACCRGCVHCCRGCGSSAGEMRGCFSGGCSNMDGDAGKALAMIALFVLAMFVVMGVFVGFFVSTIFVQAVLSRHYRILDASERAKRYVVMDLGERDITSWANDVTAVPSAPILVADDDFGDFQHDALAAPVNPEKAPSAPPIPNDSTPLLSTPFLDDEGDDDLNGAFPQKL